ncbi:MAG: LytTR family transcriptional regulator DNA-binding domain-containing protein, partial [Candidatus Weimeria sp.]
RMSGDYFSRCNRSFIINLMHVKGYDRHNVFMKDESVIPLSRNKYRELMAVHSDFLADHAVVSNKL